MDPATTRHERLYREHADAVYRYALRRDPGGAEDLVAEVFLVAWRRLDDVPAEAELPWLLGVARRAHANQRRSTGRQRALRDRLARQPEPQADDHPNLLQTDAAIHQALACLPAARSRGARPRRAGTASTTKARLRRWAARARTSPCACIVPGAALPANSSASKAGNTPCPIS